MSEVMKAGLVSIDEVELSKIRNLRYESFTLPIEDRIALQLAMKKLSDLQRKVIHMLFFKGMTQQQAAKALGINQRKVSRIRSDSLEEMKGFFNKA